MLRQKLSQKQIQKLSPQQIQLMKLLQIPTATLDQRIQEELESNPALDEGEDSNEVFDLDEKSEDSNEEEFELDDYLQEYIDDDPSYYKLKGDSYSTEEQSTMPVQVENTFHEHLLRQLGMQKISDVEDLLVARQLIGSIDHDGYLRRDLLSIVDDLMFSQNVFTTVEKLEEMLDIIQGFEPAGIGARNLQECLILQIEDKMDKDDVEDSNKQLALTILQQNFDEFSKKHYYKLKKYYELSDSQLKDALDEIIKLNPKPASGFSNNKSSSNQYVIPDFIISNRDGELELRLNNKNAPDLRINDNYMDMLKGYKDSTKGRRSTKKEKEAVLFIKQKIDSAKWFIDAIKQRQDTLYRTMYSIMQYQEEFFLTGDQRSLKPMILKDIAEITGLDISTVSRVANSKFVQTEFGTKRLKDFFSESLMTEDGTEVSTLEVKNILHEIVGGENKRKPLSDEKLKDALKDRGYNIARRTVAKYREQLNIPVARLRKELV